ncbi:ABC transporter ATP-binding protein [Natranaerobius trueperi]|uniref:ABC transporter n=1 Tax=Natranaerobius trueperi TaxID=759412 RepID=A0A226BX63_9FIRM|nr:ABC transporter ATP-binding protein [Natranaerobius trueperi]OWZ82914.1 ABC transporter [Natranaerobius trueperi]
MIKVINLKKNYGTFTAVNNINFEVEPGEIFGFLGPNGAGKTTTINMLTGLLQQTSGKIYLDGMEFHTNSREVKKVFGYAPDDPALYEKLSLNEFLDFIINIYELDIESAHVRKNQLLDVFDLYDKSDSLIGSFSRGMKQKASLIAALLPRPKILILDEPTNGLDPKSVKQLKDLLVEETKKGVSVFMSTHILEIAEKMCHKIAIIQSGELKAIGTIDEIYQMRDDETKETDLEELFLEITGGDDHDYIE